MLFSICHPILLHNHFQGNSWLVYQRLIAVFSNRWQLSAKSSQIGIIIRIMAIISIFFKQQLLSKSNKKMVVVNSYRQPDHKIRIFCEEFPSEFCFYLHLLWSLSNCIWPLSRKILVPSGQPLSGEKEKGAKLRSGDSVTVTPWQSC